MTSLILALAVALLAGPVRAQQIGDPPDRNLTVCRTLDCGHPSTSIMGDGKSWTTGYVSHCPDGWELVMRSSGPGCAKGVVDALH